MKIKKKTTADKITRAESLTNLLEDIKKEFGEGTMMTLDTMTKVNVDTISTGSPSLDLALGVAGLPRGRVVEIFGNEGSGKTTISLEVISQAQKKEGNVAFIDAEHALDVEYAKRVGVDVKKLIIAQPDSGEEALNLAERLIKSGLLDVIVIDSVAALVPRTELEGEVGDQYIGLQARMMSQALRKLTGVISKTKTILIFINQTRERIGVMFPGAGTTTPGGKALKFYASVRIELARIAQIKKGDEAIGNKIRAKIVKNKVAAPFRTAEFEIYFNEGISYEADLLNLAEKQGVVKKLGMTYYFGEIKLGGSFQSSREFLKENPKIASEIFKAISAKQNST
jgi:recombination protein RecA